MRRPRIARPGEIRFTARTLLPVALAAVLAPAAAQAAPPAPPAHPPHVLDLAATTAGSDPLTRVRGAGVFAGFPLGIFGVPVAGGSDVDGDGLPDYGVAHMLSSPAGRFLAGEVNLVFGGGDLASAVDLATPRPDVLRILGEAALGTREMTGTELWIDDVTGDGLADVLIGRQNYSFTAAEGDRFGAGALAILPGGPHLRALASTLAPVDLASPPPSLVLFQLVGGHAFDRLGLWTRTGDVDGDGIADIVVAADQETSPGDNHHGALYLIRGGAHLAVSATVDLEAAGGVLAGHLARIVPPAGSHEFHLGATCQIADLDGNGRAEVLGAAALARGSASVGPFGSAGDHHPSGGPPGGRLFILWDDAFPSAPWPDGLEIELGAAGVPTTVISGGADNRTFGEELLGGLDYDGDGRIDLFVGDFLGDGTPEKDRGLSGIGYVFYDAARLKGRSFSMDHPPAAGTITEIWGPNFFALGGDTVAHGDFDGDGRADLAVCSPHADPQGRDEAGAIHVLFGRPGRWPRLIDTAPGALPRQPSVRITEVQGALGSTEVDTGDILCYSASAGDIDGDGRTDLIVNEMNGNGLAPDTLDVGNLIVIGGQLLTPPPHPGLP